MRVCRAVSVTALQGSHKTREHGNVATANTPRVRGSLLRSSSSWRGSWLRPLRAPEFWFCPASVVYAYAHQVVCTRRLQLGVACCCRRWHRLVVYFVCKSANMPSTCFETSDACTRTHTCTHSRACLLSGMHTRLSCVRGCPFTVNAYIHGHLNVH